MFLLLSSAWAFSPRVVHTWPAEATEVAVLQGPDGGRVVTSGSAIEVWSGDGILDTSVARSAAAFTTTDLDNDGTIDLLACGPEGVRAIPWEHKGFANGALLSEEVCRAIAAVEGGFLTGGDVVKVWTNLREQEDIAVWLGDDGVLLPFADTFWAGTPGSATLQFWTGEELWSTEATGPIGGLADVDHTATWSLPELGLIVDDLGFETAVLANPTTLGVGDFDGDGEDELAVLHADAGAVGIVRDGVEVLIDGLGAPVAMAVGNLDELCASIVVVDGAEVKQIDIDDCGDDADQDGDGFTPADGDCDDLDALAAPGQAESCDGVDNDCDHYIDGRIDDLVIVAVPHDQSNLGNPVEGTQLDLTTYDSICGELERSVAWSFTGDRAADCIPAEGPGSVCYLDDDGTLEVTAYYEGDRWEMTATTVLTIENLDPEIPSECPAGCDACADYEVEVGEQLQGIVFATDVPADTVDCEVTGGPPGLVFDEPCVAHWSAGCADRGDWDVLVRATDEDGGRSDHPVHLRAGCGSPLDVCCPSGGTAMMLFLGTTFTLRRRR